MSFNQKQYINKFNKETYRMVPIRIRKDNEAVINKLDNTRNKNKYITSLIEKDVNPDVLTLRQIKERIKPVMDKYEIHDVYLFGSYSRGEANNSSDVDIFCEKGRAQDFVSMEDLREELEKALGKEVDIVFIGSRMDEYFKNQLERDLIKLC